MKILFISSVLLVSANVVWAEGPPIEWEKTFGGIDHDSGASVQQTTDGGYIITGATASYGAGNCDVWLIKVDGDGNEVWTNTFGGSEQDSGASVQQTTDGGYIIAGTTNAAPLIPETGNVWLIKTDSDGNDLWTYTFGNGSDWGASVRQTVDGGYIVAGATTSYGAGGHDVLLIKTNSDGNEIWIRTFGGSETDDGFSVQQTTDGGYVITGISNSYDVNGVLLIKTDADGNDIWINTYNSFGAIDGRSVQQTTDGGYVITGYTFFEFGGYPDVFLLKTDADGNEVWTKTFGGTGWDAGHSVQQTTDGGYIITGNTGTYGGSLWLIKTDTDGNEIWNKIIPGGNVGYSLKQTIDGGYIITGWTINDLYLVKVAADCINQPQSDLTGDCKTDFRDFAIMASEWLNCGQYDPNDCI